MQVRVPLQAPIILKRNGFRCRACGRGEKDRVKLELGRKIPLDWADKEHYEKGELHTYCEECNLGKKHFYSDFDSEGTEKILAMKSGMARLEALFKHGKW